MFLLSAAGCGGQAVNKDAKTSFLDSDDLVTMTDKMAQSILSDPDVARISMAKSMIIVVKPIVNETNEIIRGNTKELYVARLRTLLSTKPQLRDRFVFVLNKQDYLKLQSQELLDATTKGQSEERIQPEYALWGHFYADTNASSKNRSDTYLCEYKLTKLSGADAGVILWDDKYETRKTIGKSLLD